MIGDMAHLMNFWGSDTLPGKRGVNKYYHGNQDKTPTLLSVYAAEHSTVTSYGEENELFAYRELLRRVPADQIASIVIDSYDAMRAVDEYFGKDPELKYLVRVERTGKTVLRPDSGDPVEMSVKVLKSLWNNYGGTLNANGYKVLDPHVGVIYGDYISKDMINQIRGQVVGVHQFAPSNILFGMGGALIQKVNQVRARSTCDMSRARSNRTPGVEAAGNGFGIRGPSASESICTIDFGSSRSAFGESLPASHENTNPLSAASLKSCASASVILLPASCSVVCRSHNSR